MKNASQSIEKSKTSAMQEFKKPGKDFNMLEQ